MQQNGHRIGGEQSGHIIFSKYASTGDGILTAIKVMEVMLEEKQSLGNVRVRDKKTAREDKDVMAAVDAVADKLGSEGRILVRESGTEPVIRVMVEAPDDATCEKYVSEVVDVIYQKGHAVAQ